METCGFFDANLQSDGITYDRVYSASNFADYFKLLIGNGVFASPTNQLKVSAGSGLQIVISAGWAFIDGYWYHNDANKAITAAFAGKTSKVVIRLDRTNRTITAQVVTNSSTPTRTSSIYEIVLATVTAASGVTQISTSMITDKRGDSLVCGFVTGLVDVVDTGDLFAQYQAIFDDWIASVQAEEASKSASFDSWRAGEQSAFNTWFNNMKDQLSTDAAGHLQLEIDDLSNQVDAIELTNAVNIIPCNGEVGSASDSIYTINSDCSVSIVNSTVGSGDARLYYFSKNPSSDSPAIGDFGFVAGKRYKLKVLGTFPSNCEVHVHFWNGSTYVDIFSVANNTEHVFEWKSSYIGLRILFITSKSSIINATLKPMIVPEDYPITEFFPPAMTNHQLTTDKVSWALYGKEYSVNALKCTMTTNASGGVLYTVNSDKSVTVTNSVTTSPAYIEYGRPQNLVVGRTYKLSGLPEDPSTAYMKLYKNSGNVEINASTPTYTFTYDGTNAVRVEIGMRTVGTNAGGRVFKPMITDVTEEIPYVPYAKSNRELTDDVTSLEANKQPKFTCSDSSCNSCRITFTNGHGGVNGSRALVFAGGIVALGFWGGKWQIAWENLAGEQTVTHSNSDASGITLTFNLTTSVDVLPIFDADGCVITKIS